MVIEQINYNDLSEFYFNKFFQYQKVNADLFGVPASRRIGRYNRRRDAGLLVGAELHIGGKDASKKKLTDQSAERASCGPSGTDCRREAG